MHPSTVGTRVSLLERLRSPQDNAAWERFIDLYTPLMLLWSHRLGLQDSDAADLIQEVVATLLRKLPQFEYQPGGKFRGWLRTVLVNKHRERMRRKGAQIATVAVDWNEMPAPSTVTDDQEDRQLLVRRGLELIRGEYSASVWDAFWNYAVLGRPVAQVARDLGVTVGTIYASKSRVLRRLRLEIGFQPD